MFLMLGMLNAITSASGMMIVMLNVVNNIINVIICGNVHRMYLNEIKFIKITKQQPEREKKNHKIRITKSAVC